MNDRYVYGNWANIPGDKEDIFIQFHDKTLLCEILIIVANVMNVYILTSETDNHHRGKNDILNRKCQSAHRKWIGAPAMQGRMLYAI